MRRFLIVGCGGSGGKTLAYLMDQLRSDLAAHGVNELPKGWKFVHLDVPNNSEPGPDGLDSVEEQGGTYFGTGASGTSYGVLDNAVSQKFAAARRLDCIGTWAPREPDRVITPISDGAGQYRAVGRMITLSRAVDIRNVLDGVWQDLGTPDTGQDMARLPGRVPGLGAYNSNVPIVIVVSSMAGGAGASMALDICRLLTHVRGLDPKLMGVFLVAPNIFDTLPSAGRTGVRPNALAMLGEIVASQTASAVDADVRALEALGLPAGSGVETPFARVFPVGRFAGVDRTRFGDGRPETVYRGLGRGLAGLIMSGTATDQFVSYDLGNTASPNGDRDLLGWGSTWEPLPWGSYGFASLSMGRDRYREYAAQRLARSCVDRLLYGHRQRGSRAADSEQVAALLESQWAGICQRVRIPQSDAEVNGWLTSAAYHWNEADGAARAVTDGSLRPFVPQASGQQAAHWMAQVRSAVPRQEAQVRAACRQAAEVWAHRWHRDLLTRIESEVREAVARIGLPYATALADRLARHMRDIVAPGAELLAAHARSDVTVVPPTMQPTLDRLRGVIGNGQQLVDQLLQGYREQARTQIYAQAADLVRAILLGMVDEVFRPVTEAIGGAQRILEAARDADATDVGLARLETNHYAAWPSDDNVEVPDRFDHADNEVLLTRSTHFDAQYRNDLQRSVIGVPDSLLERRGEAIRQIIAGSWITTGGTPPPLDLMTRTIEWRSRVFKTDLSSGQPVLASPAEYDAHARPAEILTRARMFVTRPGESFDRFCRLSIRDFVQGGGEALQGGAAEFERDRREHEVIEKFTAALDLARPLISVDGTALQAVHAGETIQYRYKFSEVPFKALPTAERLKDVLRRKNMVDMPSRSNLENAIGDNADVTRIDIFGSYPNYSPLVFDAVLGPVADQWAEVGDIGRESFWQWRRSRPLPAALPMGDDERRTMIAGWFLGQVVGRIRIPDAPYSEAVKIFDDQTARWLDFPHPLLTPPSRFIAPYDWLPAVLESVLLAIARSHQAPVMASLRPYRALRSLYDDTSQSKASGMNVASAHRIVTEWLMGRSAVPGGRSRVAGADASTSVEERAELAITWLGKIDEIVRLDYLTPDEGGRAEGLFAVVSNRVQASRTPMFRDLAVDVRDMVGDLVRLFEEAKLTALKPQTVPAGPLPQQLRPEDRYTIRVRDDDAGQF